MENNRILNALREIGVSFKILIVSLICLVIGTVGTNYAGSFVFPIMMVLSFGVFAGSAGAVICGFIAKRRGKQKKPFLYFMIMNVVLILALVILAFADGYLLGALILQGAVPMLAGMDAALLVVWFFVKYRHRMRVSVKLLIASFFAVLVTGIAFVSTAFAVFAVMFVLAMGAFAGSAGTVISGIIARQTGKQEKPLLGFLLGDLLLILALVMSAIGVLLPEGGNEKLGHLILYVAVPLIIGFDAVVAAALHRRKVMQQEESDI